MTAPYNVLFLCTGNSARSIMAEVLLNAMAPDRFRGFSAGSHPRGEVHPMALRLIARHRLPTEGLRSKSWDEFARPGAPPLHFVFTVCDTAAGEVCPTWPGQPLTAHWGIPDPAAVTGSPEQIERAFAIAFEQLQRRISLFTSLRLESLDRLVLQRELEAIGRTADR
ncbi:MAG: arsenate reductase ArsC [Sutterellaceae bacterium]|nr:arsenate reductase ArsC [Burkholderiaceae bacterium]MDW8430447.1 arsenate reductase ArsC [Sutterellaceae bacterium]